MIVNEIDNFPMFRRKRLQALPQRRTFVLLLHRYFGIVRAILDRSRGLLVQLLFGLAPHRGERLEPRDGEQPGRHRTSTLEPVSLTPHVQKHFADQILGHCLVADEAKYEPVHTHLMTCKQHLHREPVALGDPADKNFV